MENSEIEQKIVSIRKLYKPVVLDGIKVDAIALEPIAKGEKGKVARKMFIISQHPFFSKIATNLLQRFNGVIDVGNTNQLLVIIKPNDQAFIYPIFPLSAKIVPKKQIIKYQPIYKKDIVDISSASFDDGVIDLNPQENDKIIFLYRESWNFGLFFDFTKKIDIEKTKEDLGYCMKRLLYQAEYDFVNSQSSYNQLIKDGWFPFVNLIGEGIEKIIEYYQDNKKHPHILEDVVNSFDRQRVEEISNRWWNNKIFNSKKKILSEGIECFLEEKYISACKTFSIEIEGIMQIAFHKDFSRKPSTRDLISYIRDQGVNYFYSQDSLAFPGRFLDYLSNYIFQRFDVEQNIIPESRHTIAHGVADQEIYNKSLCVKLLLTLDNIYFYFGDHFHNQIV